MLAQHVIVLGITLELFDLSFATPGSARGAWFGAIAAVPGTRPGPIERWIVDGDGTLRLVRGPG